MLLLMNDSLQTIPGEQLLKIHQRLCRGARWRMHWEYKMMDGRTAEDIASDALTRTFAKVCRGELEYNAKTFFKVAFGDMWNHSKTHLRRQKNFLEDNGDDRCAQGSGPCPQEPAFARQLVARNTIRKLAEVVRADQPFDVNRACEFISGGKESTKEMAEANHWSEARVNNWLKRARRELKK